MASAQILVVGSHQFSVVCFCGYIIEENNDLSHATAILFIAPTPLGWPTFFTPLERQGGDIHEVFKFLIKNEHEKVK